MIVSSVIQSSVFAKVAGVCVLGLGLSLGGCNKQLKDDNAALMTQNSALIAENNQLKINQDAMSGRIQNLETASTASTAQSQPMTDTYTGGGSGSQRPAARQRNETIVIAGDVLFDPGQATIKSTARKELDSVASNLKSRHSGQEIRVEGYTDSDPIKKSKWGSNEALSEARAESVRKYLITKGISSSRVSAVGMGAAKPKSNKKESRRVEIVVVDG